MDICFLCYCQSKSSRCTCIAERSSSSIRSLVLEYGVATQFNTCGVGQYQSACLWIGTHRNNDDCITCYLYLDSTISAEIPTMGAIVEWTTCNLNRLVVLGIEHCIIQWVSENSACFNYLNRSNQCLNSGVAINHITNSCFLTTCVIPSAELITLCYCRKISFCIRNLCQSSALVSLYATQLCTILIFENNLTRSNITCLCKEIRHISVTCHSEHQCSRLTCVSISHILCKLTSLFATRSIVANRCERSTVFCYSNIATTVLARTDGKLHWAIYRNGNSATVNTMLTTIVLRTFYQYTRW